jgi:hypothetical protein
LEVVVVEEHQLQLVIPVVQVLPIRVRFKQLTEVVGMLTEMLEVLVCPQVHTVLVVEEAVQER